jgi:adenosylhomocysteine nucleosidase
MNAERGTQSAESEPDSAKYLICFALEEEAHAIPRKVWGERGKVLVTGIGRKNAEKSVAEFLNRHAPRRVLTCGFAGGIDPELRIGEVIFETSDSRLREKLTKAGAQPVRFVCSARVAITSTEKAALRRTFGADAVEMESEAIQAICGERGIPCATVRVISDSADEDLPLDFNALSNPDLSLNYRKLAWAVAKSPGKIPALLRLQRNCGIAARKLAEVLAKVIEPK